MATDAFYTTRQITRLRELQRDLAERNRQDSLQLLRIQNDLNAAGLAMRDMIDPGQRYPLTAWRAPFSRLRADLDAALEREGQLAVARRTPEQRQYLANALAQFWDAVDRMFALAAEGRDAEAREQIRVSLQARQAALGTAVARLLVENNAAEEETAARVEAIYRRVQRQVYWFLAATLGAIAATSLYLIRSNRRLFAAISAISARRRELAQQLISAREATLRHVSRELHDELGQVLTAMGLMLGRAARRTPEESALRRELREINELAQGALDNVRRLSQALHPSLLDEAGLESALEWYLPAVERQSGLTIVYERPGGSGCRSIDGKAGIHVFRVVQEAVTNVVRHAGADRAWVRLRYEGSNLVVEIEDHGKGFDGRPRHGLGVVAMRERADLLGGSVEFSRPHGGGTLVTLRVPLGAVDAGAA